jgi:hypothetical protein
MSQLMQKPKKRCLEEADLPPAKRQRLLSLECALRSMQITDRVPVYAPKDEECDMCISLKELRANGGVVVMVIHCPKHDPTAIAEEAERLAKEERLSEQDRLAKQELLDKKAAIDAGRGQAWDDDIEPLSGETLHSIMNPPKPALFLTEFDDIEEMLFDADLIEAMEGQLDAASLPKEEQQDFPSDEEFFANFEYFEEPGWPRCNFCGEGHNPCSPCFEEQVDAATLPKEAEQDLPSDEVFLADFEESEEPG